MRDDSRSLEDSGRVLARGIHPVGREMHVPRCRGSSRGRLMELAATGVDLLFANGRSVRVFITIIFPRFWGVWGYIMKRIVDSLDESSRSTSNKAYKLNPKSERTLAVFTGGFDAPR